jgi:hypothetical protein
METLIQDLNNGSSVTNSQDLMNAAVTLMQQQQQQQQQQQHQQLADIQQQPLQYNNDQPQILNSDQSNNTFQGIKSPIIKMKIIKFF